MKIDKSVKLIYTTSRAPGAVINAVPVPTIDGTAHSGHGIACVGYEAGATPLTGEATRKGGSRVYAKLTVNRGDIKVIPVTGESGDIIGVEFAASGDDASIALTAASGDDASIALTAAIAEMAEHLKMDL